MSFIVEGIVFAKDVSHWRGMLININKLFVLQRSLSFK